MKLSELINELQQAQKSFDEDIEVFLGERTQLGCRKFYEIKLLSHEWYSIDREGSARAAPWNVQEKGKYSDCLVLDDKQYSWL
jgi:hypothetical protein